jgi:hypothetical protein
MSSDGFASLGADLKQRGVGFAKAQNYDLDACKASNKSSFGVRSTNNHTTGGNNMLWQHGGGDAGNWGTMHREETATHAAAYNPRLRRSGAVEHSHMHQAGRHREGLDPAPDWQKRICPPGQTLYSWQDNTGQVHQTCITDQFADTDLKTCGARWDETATSEAQALATAGAFQHDRYGEAQLQKAINSAYDTGGMGDLVTSLGAADPTGDSY